jgi:hypothetical protein
MTKLISAASHAASRTMADNGHSIKRSHVSEVLAAMLGYQTYAALTVEEQDDGLDHHLDDAEILVLNQPAAERRAQALGAGAVPELVQACVSAMQSIASMRVHEGLDHFYDDYAREALVDTITSSDEVSAAMSETNAYFDGEAELPEAMPDIEDLWEARIEWSIEATGDLKGSHDIDSDRMFAGDKLNCHAKLMFAKAGRAGLILVNAEGSAGVDDSWREADHDAEAAYMESLDKLDF